jgi:DNA-binding SARP family transcriptional activator
LVKPCDYVVVRIQLHGRFTIEIDGQAVERLLPGRRARLLVAYLASHPQAVVERGALIDLLWQPEVPNSGAGPSFAALLSKTRSVLSPAEIRGRGSLQLAMPSGGLIDSHRASAALHEAEAAVASKDWRRVWTEALSAVFVTQRPFLPDFSDDWVVQRRTELGRAHLRATACYAQACLQLGGPELASAERAAHRLVDADPLAERGYCLLMRALAGQGDRAAALRVFEQLRQVLRDDLGTFPSSAAQQLHQALL